MLRNAYVLLVLTTLFWAGNAVAGKLAIGHISPMLLNTMRWMVGGAVLGVLFRDVIRAEWPVVRQNAALLFLLGGFGFTGFSVALYAGVVHTTAINVSIEQAAMPVVVFLANFLLFRTGVTAAQVAGFLLSVAGVALTISHGEPARLMEMDFNVGDLMMLAGVLCYGGYTAALRLKPGLRWQTFLFALMLAGFVTSLPFSAWEFASGAGTAPTATGWALVAYTALFPSLLGQAFYIRGVEMIGANRAGLFINLVPIFATLLSILVLGEAFHAYHAAALAMVLGGIWLAENSGRKRGSA